MLIDTPFTKWTLYYRIGGQMPDRSYRPQLDTSDKNYQTMTTVTPLVITWQVNLHTQCSPVRTTCQRSCTYFLEKFHTHQSVNVLCLPDGTGPSNSSSN